jgi:tetratricopeptide (TPR) repeat protein
MKKFTIFLISILLLFKHPVFAQEKSYQFLQSEWDRIMYSLKSTDEKEEQMEKLSEKAIQWVDENKKSAELHAWAGIIISTEAGFYKINVVKALTKAKKAKELLQTGLDINEKVLDGAIYTTLGTLYYQVPPFPLGFGDKDLAKKYLEKSIQLNPNGIDSNYFFASYLYEEKLYKESLDRLAIANNAKPREGRELADKGRKVDIEKLIAKVQEKLK